MVENHFNVVMETPKTSIVNVYSADMEYNLNNDIYLDAVQSILNMTYTKTLREDEGGTLEHRFKISSSQPEEYGGIIIVFDTDPERQERMSQVVRNDFLNLGQNGPVIEYVTKTRENFLKNRQENVIRNSFWQQSLISFYTEELDIVTGYEEIVKGITPSSVQEFIKNFLKQNNYIDIKMNPAQ